mmetsp:Transcript_17331/g.27644  ORF Transcript_17331/g.27644 Transcript_17331/m.27644 type:complete len:170 (-) Transcript_17331:348-857(-)
MHSEVNVPSQLIQNSELISVSSPSAPVTYNTNTAAVTQKKVEQVPAITNTACLMAAYFNSASRSLSAFVTITLLELCCVTTSIFRVKRTIKATQSAMSSNNQAVPMTESSSICCTRNESNINDAVITNNANAITYKVQMVHFEYARLESLKLRSIRSTNTNNMVQCPKA